MMTLPALAFNAQWRERSLTLFVFLEVIVVFVAGPLQAMHAIPAMTGSVLDVLIVLAVLVVTSDEPRAQGVILFAALIDALSLIVRATEPTMFTLAIDLAARMLFFSALTVVLIRAVYGNDGEGTYHRIIGAVGIYINIALIFAFLYRVALLLDPHAFGSNVPVTTEAASQCVYFSFVSLTTTGYGDITPLNPLVRSAANLESVIGTLFPATLLARLVTRYFA
jgi:Ion channel